MKNDFNAFAEFFKTVGAVMPEELLTLDDLLNRLKTARRLKKMGQSYMVSGKLYRRMELSAGYYLETGKLKTNRYGLLEKSE